MDTRHFIYPMKHPVTGDPINRLGMLSVLDESEMGRVPEGAVEVSGQPVTEDPAGIYFEAWELDGDTVTINIEKAIEVRMKWLRGRRKSMLEVLDSKQLQFYCKRDEKAIDEVEAEKQELRDFPAKVNWDVIKTLHDVQHILPPRLI